MTTKAEAPSIDLDDLAADETMEASVVRAGKTLDWTWTFAGPGHPKTVALADKLSREDLELQRKIEMAQFNRKKFKPEERTVEESRRRHADLIVGRLLGWSPISMGGKVVTFSEEKAYDLLLDPRYGWLASWALELIGDERSFMNSSAKT